MCLFARVAGRARGVCPWSSARRGQGGKEGSQLLDARCFANAQLPRSGCLHPGRLVLVGEPFAACRVRPAGLVPCSSVWYNLPRQVAAGRGFNESQPGWGQMRLTLVLPKRRILPGHPNPVICSHPVDWGVWGPRNCHRTPLFQTQALQARQPLPAGGAGGLAPDHKCVCPPPEADRCIAGTADPTRGRRACR